MLNDLDFSNLLLGTSWALEMGSAINILQALGMGFLFAHILLLESVTKYWKE